MSDHQHQWLLNRTPPEGWPTNDDFRWVESLTPDPAEGQALSRNLYLSLDPYQWGRRRSGVEAPGELCHGRTVSQVTKSRHQEFKEGDFIFNTLGWQEYGLTGKDISTFNYMIPRKLDPTLAPISTALGPLGMLGLTAWSGLVVQCDPKPAETVVVSAASGGVGQLAGQIAKIRGCRVIGIAGKPEKCAFVKDELGFDDCVSYQAENFPALLDSACPDGIDIYFENVGGPVFEGVLPNLNRAARITLCGMISQYGNQDGQNASEIWHQTGKPYFERQSVTVHSLFVGNFVTDYQTRFLEEMTDWIQQGKIRYREDLWRGLYQAPKAFGAMLRGDNFGKTMVSVGTDPTLNDTISNHRDLGNILA